MAESSLDPAPASGRGARVADGALALLLCAAALAYLWLLPRHLMIGDESRFLYEAKRIRDGEVMYRDIFQFITPLSAYVMAAMFWLFGTTMNVAFATMAVVHASMVVALYATARCLHVRRELAVIAPLAYLGICYPLFPNASWHWFSTLGTALLLLSLVVSPWPRRPRWAALPGVLNGIVIGIQQQKGVVLAAGIAAMFVLNALIDLRYPRAQRGRSPLRQLAWFGVGVGLVVVPLLAACGLMAGPGTLYAALVRFPLENYRSHIGCAWGAPPPFGDDGSSYSFPLLLRYSPATLLLPGLACILMTVQGRARQAVRALTMLIAVAGFSALSIRYYPDVVHIAFIAAGFWVCAVVGAEWILSMVRPPVVGRVVGALAAVLVGGALAVHLERFQREMVELVPISHDTAFGRLDFASEWEPLFIDAVRERLATAESQEIFCYGLAAPYLTTGGRNPTPYQFLEPAISPRSHTQNTLVILKRRRVPYIISGPFNMTRDNPITRFILANYAQVSLPQVDAVRNFSTLALYARKNEPAQ